MRMSAIAFLRVMKGHANHAQLKVFGTRDVLAC
jgi:hypothetical protein